MPSLLDPAPMRKSRPPSPPRLPCSRSKMCACCPDRSATLRRPTGPTCSGSTPTGSFVDVARLWKSGDRIEMALPMRLTTEPLPDSGHYAAFFYGPILLAGRLGTEGLTPADFHGGGPNDVPVERSGQTAQKKIPESHVPVFVGTARDALPRIIPVPGHPLTFQRHGLAQPHDVTLVPFYRLFFERYALYWNVLTPDAYTRRQAQMASEQRDADTLEARTIDRVRVGETASEAAHLLAADRSATGGAGAPFTHWRDALGSFSYTLKVPTDQPAALRCVYWGSDAARTFDILVDGIKIATQTLSGARPGEYLPMTYPIPDALTHGKDRVMVRFVAKAGQTAGGLFDLRVV